MGSSGAFSVEFFDGTRLTLLLSHLSRESRSRKRNHGRMGRLDNLNAPFCIYVHYYRFLSSNMYVEVVS